MTDIIVLAVIAAIVCAAAAYVIKAKKNDAKCIGCPSGGNCHSHSANNDSEVCTCGCGKPKNSR